MKTYPKYKDSGVPWLGDVPEHWEVLRLGSQFTERKQKVSDKDFVPLSVTKKGILHQLDTAAKTNDGDNRKKVCSGDFVINSRSDRKGSSGISSHTGSASLINTVLTPISLEGRFVHNFFRSHSFQEEFYRVGRGIVADLWSTKYADMRTIMIPVPTEDEQQQISRYLDWKTSKINQFIKAKKKLVTLLKEQKQNIINEAVTKGIYPDVEMKDSGVEWLGMIPAHWGDRFFFQSFREKSVKNKGLVEKNRLSLSYGRIIRKSIDSAEGLLPMSFETYQIVERGDLILRLTDLQNDHKSLRVGLVQERGIITSAYLCLKTFPTIIPEYAYLLLHAYDLRKVFYSMGGGVRQSIGFSELKRLPFPVPTEEEQKAIVARINSECKGIDLTIKKAEREIELIQEYRTRLVSDVVTGKIDVRSVAIPDFDPVEADLEVQVDKDSDEELDTEGEE